MPKDFGLIVDPLTGEVDFEYDEVAKNFVVIDDCRNNLILSIMIAKGSLFSNPDFGSTHREVKKNIAGAVDYIKSRLREAVKWMIDNGRCNSIDIDVQIDENENGRVNIEVIARQTDGRDVPFTTFLRVI